ncbi:MAG: hypothetical protein PHO32_08250 [Candidatus Cloacimonetes bacterium]|nr:hypothetical protein [Candidatus Cloacimonadota bacterium]
MLVTKDQSSIRIVRNFVAMTDKKMFCAKDISIEAGINLNTARNQLRLLEIAGVIKRLAVRIRTCVYYRRIDADEADNASLIELIKTKSVAQIASEKGCSKEAVYQKIRKTSIPREYRLSANQLAALTMLKDGEVHSSVCYYRTIQQMADKGWTVVYEGLMPKYQITELGKEVLRAQS